MARRSVPAGRSRSSGLARRVLGSMQKAHRVSGAMMRLAPSADGPGRIARLLEEGTIRPDVATVYALQDAAQAWKDITGNLPGVHGMSLSGPGAARRMSHGKIVLRVDA